MEAVWWNPIRSAAEYRDVVDPEEERLAFLEIMLHKFDFAKSKLEKVLIVNDQRVQWLFSVSMWPPKLNIRYIDFVLVSFTHEFKLHSYRSDDVSRS